MIILKTIEELRLMKESAQLVSKTLGMLAKEIKPGVTTLYLDKLAHDFIKDHGGYPAFLGMYGFPNSLCISPNEEVVHGIPNDKPLKEGDVLSVDCGVYMNDFYGDHAYSFEVGEVAPETKKLLKITKESLYKGIEQCVRGKRVGDISFAIQNYCEKEGYGVVRELVGHGLGRTMHEDPQVPNYGRKGSGKVLKDGIVLAIEPMINMGTEKVKFHKDGWTVTTLDNKPSAHFEHDVAIINGKPVLLSTFKYIYEAFRNYKQRRRTVYNGFLMKKIASFLLNKLPRPMLINLSIFLRPLIYQFFKGNKFTDPIDGKSYRKFLPYGYGKQRENALSPGTLSLERHRQMWLYLQNETDFFTKNYKVLHIAPEQEFLRKFKKMKNLDYTSADLFSPIVDVKADILDLPFADESFDVIFCNHVLEHIKDDRKAMSELYRVMKKGGWGILQVPMKNSLEKTYEDFTITEPKERQKHFGQYDHVCWYGMDYFDRLKSVGFDAEVNFYSQKFSEEDIKKFGLNKNEILPIIKKI